MKKIGQALVAVIHVCGLAALSLTATAQLPPPTDDAKDAFPPQKHYSPYAGRSFPEMPLWGDTHLHTSLSFDA